MSLLEHMCPKCDYYMPLKRIQAEADAPPDFIRECRNCGHSDFEKPGLVMETVIQEKAAETFSVVLNEYTKKDPRLPHLNNLKCPNQTCPSRQAGGPQSDIIYIKYDIQNMKYLYICTHCDQQWRTR